MAIKILEKELPCVHWSGTKWIITKTHQCEGGAELMFDKLSGEWLRIDEYVDEFNYCPWCGERLEK